MEIPLIIRLPGFCLRFGPIRTQNLTISLGSTLNRSDGLRLAHSNSRLTDWVIPSGAPPWGKTMESLF
ncbi:hypothetical protein CHARACLAT_030771 [Characodon lateralis]|uniref:Uncharacterized protein n=1 Tax=Characodon lateralis TaxID=208331 RepID=A0ABU7F819_9TELE|nr:hypothetical protein [Characodon lateralis]